MKLIIEFSSEDLTLDMFNGHDSSFYKNRGILLNEDYGTIYYEVEMPFMPIEGQRLGTRLGDMIVSFSSYEIEEKENADYFERSRIIVEEERSARCK